VATFAEGHTVDVERLVSLVNAPGSRLRLLPPDRISLGTLPGTPKGVLDRLRELDHLLSRAA
jgi:hypothetical protein